MAIKDLLVAYQGDEGSRTALTFALQMAKKYDAVVTGAHVSAPNQYAKETNRWISRDVLDMMRAAEKRAMDSIESAFREDVRAIDASARHDWIGLTGAPGLLLARLSRYFDVLLTGHFGAAIRQGGSGALQPEELIRRSGRPTIILPEDYQIRPFKEEAVVAWDGSSSAARALSDAMQILETKKRIDIVTVEAEGADWDTRWLGDHDIVGHLQRHGVDARRVPLKRSGSVGRTILDYCAETDPDLLVMGAFGRGKLGAMLFGGVSSHILQHQKVPILMSH